MIGPTWARLERSWLALIVFIKSSTEAASDVGRQPAEDEGGEVAQELEARHLPVPQHLLEDGELFVVVRWIANFPELLPDEAQVADEDRLVVGERVEGGLENKRH